jgi:predicted ATPase
MKIDRIRIVGFKSVADLTLDDLTPYSVFAGPNGAGKSNLMDALAFVQCVIESGAVKALRKFNGFSQVHCYRFKKHKARTFEFIFEATLDDKALAYHLKIHGMDVAPTLEETLTLAGKTILERKKGVSPTLTTEELQTVAIPEMPADHSALMFTSFDLPLYRYLTNIQVFRFDPIGAKEPDASSADAGGLDQHGHNVATMLGSLEKDAQFRDQIMEWMELIVPGMQHVRAEQQVLDGRTVIKFKEEGTRAHFPAHLISDGTIYALCIMTAVLSRARGHGMTLIEEPERGIHPKAIAELVQFMRDNATPEHPVMVTTHSESVVRASRADELWLVNKEDGKTVAKNAARHSGDLGALNLDKAWLMNLFDGGLPW